MPERHGGTSSTPAPTVLLRQPVIALAQSGHGWSVQLREQRFAGRPLCWRSAERRRACSSRPRSRRCSRRSVSCAACNTSRFGPPSICATRTESACRTRLCAARRSGQRPPRPMGVRSRPDRSGQPGIFSVVIGAPALRVERERDALCSAADRQLRSEFGLPPSIAQNIVIERRATLLPASGCDGRRRVLRPRACTWRRHRQKSRFRRRSKARAVGPGGGTPGRFRRPPVRHAARRSRWQSSRETVPTTRPGKR